MKKYYYYKKKTKGPYSFDELKKEGLDPGTLIWFDGLDNWTPIEQIKEIEDILTSNNVSSEVKLLSTSEDKFNSSNNLNDESSQKKIYAISQKNFFSKLFSFKGRIRRLEYLLTFIFLIIIYVVAILFALNSENTDLSGLQYLILYIWLAQGAKRSHDIGQSGWLQLIPFYNIALFFLKGKQNLENEYGVNPRIKINTISSTHRNNLSKTNPKNEQQIER